MRKVPLRPFALVMLALGCGGDSPTSSTPGGKNISLETSRAVSDSVGPAGGSLTARGADGIAYTLLIPAGALVTTAKITLTPIASEEGLPMSGGFAAGVDLAPVGLHFARAAQLTIAPAPAPPTGMVTAAVSFEGDGDSLGLAIFAEDQGGLTASVTHFSGLSVTFGTTADVQALAALVTTASASQPFINQLAALGTPPSSGDPSALPILQEWFSTVILPGLQGARTDAELLLAIGDYDEWGQAAHIYLSGSPALTGGLTSPSIPSVLATEQSQAATAAAASLRQAIAGSNSVCLTQHDFQALLNVLFWQGYAQYFGVDTPAEQLDVSSLLPGLCAQFVADSVDLVDPLPVGQTVSFDQVWVVEIGSSPPLIPADFAVNITATGPVSVSTPSGFTGPDPEGGSITHGFYTTVVTGQQAGNATLHDQACLISPFSSLGQPLTSGFCNTVDVVRQVGSGGSGLAGTWTGSFIYVCNNVFQSGGLTVDVEGDSTAISGTWDVASINCAPGGIHGTFTATMDPAQGQLLSLSMVADGCEITPAVLEVGATSGTFGPGNGVPFEIQPDSLTPGGGWICSGLYAVQPTALAFRGPVP